MNAEDSEPTVDSKLNSNPKPVAPFQGYYIFMDEISVSRSKPATRSDEIESRFKEVIEEARASGNRRVEEKEGGIGWAGESYEKWHRPRGYDKAFKQFTNEVQVNPEQCLR